MDKRPNFYQVLDLSPVIHDWPTIEAAILNKQREWGRHRNQGTPKQRRLAEKYSLLITDMTEYLKSPENVTAELKAFKQQQAKAKQANLAKLDDLIDTISGKVVPKALLKKLVQATDKQFTEQGVEQRLVKKGYQLEGSNKPKKAKTVEQLEASVAKEINEQLSSIHLNSLYEFLTVDHTTKLHSRSSAQALFERADQIYKQLSAVGKTDQQTTLQKQLAGHTKSVFKNEAEKVKYDNTLALKVVAELNPYIEVAGIDGFIETSELQTIMVQAKQRNIDPDIAMSHIESVAAKRKWGIQQTTEQATQLLQCGYCNALAKSVNEKRCHDCGEALIQLCPHCGTPTPTERSACPECGCHIGDAPLVKALYKQSQINVGKGELKEALALIDRVLHYWPKWADALNEKQRLEASIEQQQSAISELQGLIRVKNLEAAQAKVQSLGAMQSYTDITLLAKQIQMGLSQATALYEKAQQLNRAGKPDQAFDQFEVALSHCADHTLSKQAMAKSPPPPPSALNSSWIGKTLRLSWTAAKAKGQLSYQVVRKTNGVPANPQDGQVFGKVDACQIDDTNIQVGHVYYYAVYTLRGGANSTQYVHSGPHLLVKDIEQLSYQSGNKQVAMKWQKPNGCQGVEVWRALSGQPLKRGMGKQLSVSADSLLDTSLTNGQRYDYLLVAKFNDPKRQHNYVYAKGIQFSATPVAPAKPVSDLTAQRRGQQVLLHWTPLVGPGHIEIRQTRQLPPFSPGQVISLSDAATCGKVIPATSNNQTQTTIDVQGRLYFIPLTVLEQSVTFGTPTQITTLDEVSNVVSRRQGKSIPLTWHWPVGASEVLVSYRHDEFPTDVDDPMAVSYLVTKAEYDSNLQYLIRHAEKKKYYFKLFVTDANAQIYSSGVTLLEAMGQEGTVRYQVGIERKLFARHPKAAWIELTYQAGEALNGLVVVMKPKFPPTSKDDGVKLAHINLLRFMGDTARITIPEQYLSSKGYVKLFFENDESVKEVRLLPMAKEKLQIA